MKSKNKGIRKLKQLALLAMVVFILMGDVSILTCEVYADSPTQIAGQWIQSSNGKWWYRHTDGSYTVNDWEYINGYWYHFDSSGWMQTGWLFVNSTWYYLGTSGAMCTGWQHINNYWYFFASSGAMCTGWQAINNYWYYFTTTGKMCIGWQYINLNSRLFFSLQ